MNLKNAFYASLRLFLCIVFIPTKYLFTGSFENSPKRYSSAPEDIREILDQVNVDSLVYFVRELSGDTSTFIDGKSVNILSRGGGANPGPDARYIEKKLSTYGLQAYCQEISIYTNYSVGRNIIAEQIGNLYPDKKYIICAHYDSFGSSPGADDNASGTAAVIEAARIFSNYHLPATIVYALWDNEERGLVYNGCQYFVQQALKNGQDILGVINLDMIGYDSNSDNLFTIHTKNIANSIQCAERVVAMNLKYSIGLVPIIINPGWDADHGRFWDENISAIAISEHVTDPNYNNDFNPYYHTNNDRIKVNGMVVFNYSYFKKCASIAFVTLASYVMYFIPNAPILIYPTGKETFIPATVTLAWRSSYNATHYDLQIATDAGFANIVYDKYSLSDTLVTVQLGFKRQYYWQIKAKNSNGSSDWSPITSFATSNFSLNQNYPNPFNTETQIMYTLPCSANVSLKVFSILGKEVTTLIRQQLTLGTRSVVWNSGNLPNGIYYIVLEASGNREVRKAILMR